jgi:hypothetical protein
LKDEKFEPLVVPEKTIAFFPIAPQEGLDSFDLKNIGLFLRPLNTDHKRDWFTPNFYKCLPLAIGNMQGFVFSLPYGFDVLWNGGGMNEDLQIKCNEDVIPFMGTNFIHPNSEFGSGIITIHFPLTLKTPPGVNLMTIAPPNYPLPGLSPLTGVVEADNLRFTFTLNIKVDIPNVPIHVLPNTPLVGLIPIPRYFCDQFELKNAYDIFTEEEVEEEKTVVEEHGLQREKNNGDYKIKDGLYYKGEDFRGNKFKDHQLPKKQKK